MLVSYGPISEQIKKKWSIVQDGGSLCSDWCLARIWIVIILSLWFLYLIDLIMSGIRLILHKLYGLGLAVRAVCYSLASFEGCLAAKAPILNKLALHNN